MKTDGLKKHIALDELLPNPWQPREAVEVPEDFVESIRGGLLQIPVARVKDGNIELADGHRRLAAFKVLHAREPDHAFFK